MRAFIRPADEPIGCILVKVALVGIRSQANVITSLIVLICSLLLACLEKRVEGLLRVEVRLFRVQLFLPLLLGQSLVLLQLSLVLGVDVFLSKLILLGLLGGLFLLLLLGFEDLRLGLLQVLSLTERAVLVIHQVAVLLVPVVRANHVD